MPAEDGSAFLLLAYNEEEESKLFNRWLIAGQFEMSFNEFKQKLTSPKDFDEEKVLDDIASLMESVEG